MDDRGLASVLFDMLLGIRQEPESQERQSCSRGCSWMVRQCLRPAHGARKPLLFIRVTRPTVAAAASEKQRTHN